MSEMMRILIVEDLPTDAGLCEREVRQVLPLSEFRRVETREDFLAALETFQPDLILSDYSMPRFDGMAALKLALAHVPETPFLILTGSMNEETAVACMKAGAWDYIIKEHIRRLGPAVLAALEQKKVRRERRMAEELRRESEERLRDIIFSIADWVWEVDEKGVYTYSSQQGPELLGESRGDIIGKTPFDFMPPDEAKRVAAVFSGIVVNKAPIKDLENWNIRKDGERICLLTNGLPILDEEGNLKGYRGVDKDITERKKAEMELKESKALIEAVVENAPLMIFLKEATDLRFVIFNRAGEELLGYDRKDLIGKNNLDLFPPEQAAHFMAKDREVIDGEPGMLDIPEEPLLTAKKGQRLLHTRKVCIRGADGKTKYLLGISEDITEFKKAQEELQQSFERLRKTLEATVQAIAMVIEARDPYTAGHQRRVAHLSLAIAEELKLKSDHIEGLHMAAMIHDIGKISVPAEILSKPTKLTPTEFSLTKVHPQTGYDILKEIDFPWPVAQMVFQHHEKMDGSGYPNGLKGEDILLDARIIAVADVVEAMASHRPYRPALGIDVALNEIEKNRGSFYDDAVVDACLRLFREKGFQLEGA
jgi:PAS domain S-box-containing protein